MKNKHLTQDERLEIEKCLKENLSFREIGKKLCKDCTTISKEIRNHIKYEDLGAVGRPIFDCKRSKDYPYREKGKNVINVTVLTMKRKCVKNH